jgi:hypothetical protein
MSVIRSGVCGSPGRERVMSESLAAVDAGAVTAGSGNVVSRNPNASVALGSGAALGPLIVWFVGLTGTPMSAEVGAAFGGVVAASFLLIGRRGIRGLLAQIWRGGEGEKQ